MTIFIETFQPIEEMIEELEVYTRDVCPTKAVIAKFTLDILHGGYDHKRWLINAAFNVIHDDDVNFVNEFKE